MCTICVAFTPHMPDCAYRALGVLPPDADQDAGTETSSGTAGQSTFANQTISEGADAAASTATAYTMEVTDTYVGSLSTAGDRDWIAIDLTAGQTYVFTVSGAGSPALSDGFLRLRDADGFVIGVNDDGASGLNPALGFTAAHNGTYYLDIGGFQDIRTGGYSLSAAVDAGSAPFGTHDELATYLTDGFWEDFSSSAHAFNTTLSSTITVDISRLTPDGQRLALWSLQAFEQVVDLTFDVITIPGTFDPGSSSFNPYAFADITFYDDDPGAFASFVADGNGNTQRAWINVSTAWLSSNGTEVNDYAFQTYLHEVGHALGLGHQGNYNGGATFGSDNTFGNDSWLVSVMSYFHQDESLYTGSTYAAVISPMLVDIIALQSMYGAASGSGSPTGGDTVYGVGHTFAAAFAGSDLNTYGSYLAAAFDYISTGSDPNGYFDATTIAFTITDVGGIDLIDFSTDLFNQVVSLMEETLSTVFNPLSDGRNDNMWIARSTVIENYRAGLGDDSISGNEVANEISGNDGDDTIFGAQGNDLLIGDLGDDSLEGGEGNDTLEGGGNADLLRGGLGADSLRGDDGADILHGGAGADTIIGGDDNDQLFGDQSTDLLIGGAGADTMDGGVESDVYYVTTGDRITDTGGAGYDRAQVTETAGQVL